ncbi:hypothetical protein ACFO4P_14130 [Epilithonimonas pallida]|uniref:DNA polymerase-3 subunit gamma/tau n=1 Tax=Epilithonimonas pallida TaxID=373671 RepID=A0ABY1QYA1_9FLAO|nr:hypothetical protein [Epilithonimonas pallida]SMP86484.1 DNA polymerase-3 subunit gamma/tau [Epilithonimonas pallida]
MISDNRRVPVEAKTQIESKPEPVKSVFEEPKKIIQKASEPIAKINSGSKFSIKAALEKKEEVETDKFADVKDENLPSNHFTQTDLDKEWDLFLKNLAKTNTFVYNAINSFKLEKFDEHQITVKYSSETAKAEFDRLSIEFFNHFKHKVNNFKIEIDYQTDLTIKKEVITKRKIFERFVEINPVLKDLDDLMKFDLT